MNKVPEPVRKYIYGILTAVAAVLIMYGVLTDTEVVAWMAVVQAVLVVPFVEGARAKVTPLDEGPQHAKDHSQT